jgi:hypothetical protein
MSKVTIAGLSLRSIIKVEGPNTTLREVLKNFCTKNSLTEPDKYSLYDMKGKKVNLSETWRLSGLNNNATLEIKENDKKKEVKKKEAKIVFQNAEGDRKEGVFETSTTLWEIIEHFEKEFNQNFTKKMFLEKNKKKEVYMIPSIIFLNKPVFIFNN